MVADAGLRSQLGPGAGLPVRHQAGTPDWNKLWEKTVQESPREEPDVRKRE